MPADLKMTLPNGKSGLRQVYLPVKPTDLATPVIETEYAPVMVSS